MPGIVESTTTHSESCWKGKTMNTVEYWESQQAAHKTVDVTLTIDELKLIIGWGNVYLDHATVEEDEDGRLHARLEETLRETQS